MLIEFFAMVWRKRTGFAWENGGSLYLRFTYIFWHRWGRESLLRLYLTQAYESVAHCNMNRSIGLFLGAVIRRVSRKKCSRSRNIFHELYGRQLEIVWKGIRLTALTIDMAVPKPDHDHCLAGGGRNGHCRVLIEVNCLMAGGSKAFPEGGVHFHGTNDVNHEAGYRIHEANDENPVAYDRIPEANDENPVAYDRIPGRNEENPVAYDRIPGRNEENHEVGYGFHETNDENHCNECSLSWNERRKSRCDDALSLWDEALSLWDGALSLWDGALSLWDDALSLWDDALSLWDDALSLWDDALSLWDDALSLWDDTLSLRDDTLSLRDDDLRGCQ